MKKIVLTAMVIVLIVAALVGCSMQSPIEPSQSQTQSAAAAESGDESASDKANEPIKVAYTTMTLGSPYFVEVSNGIKDAGEALGWEVTIHDSKMDVASQVSALETYINQGYDAIFISAVDGTACAPLVAKAVEQGIYCITEATIVDGTSAHVGPEEMDMGYTLGTAVGKWCQANLTGDIKGVTFGTINDPYTRKREEGMRQGLNEQYKNGKVTYINEPATIGGVVPEDGMKNMEGILQSHPDINVIMSCNDDSAMGAYEAAKSASVDLTKMCFGGVNAVEQALDLIKSEKDANEGAYRVTIDITPYDTGAVCIDTAKQLMEGKTFTEQVVIPAKAVTWDNIDEYFK